MRCIDITMKECEDGIHMRPMSEFSFRKESGDNLEVKLLATKFGKPWPNLEIGFLCVKQSGKDRYCSPDVTLPTGLTTNKDGIVTTNITLPVINTPRKFIDGQLYPIFYYPKNTCLARDLKRLQKQTDYVIIVKVYDHFESPEKITWTEHVYPIFKEYADLYPVMKGPTFDMSDYDSVVKHKDLVSLSMNLPITHNSFMPATRDLSIRKRRMITKWLADETPVHGDPGKLITVKHLRVLLQTALEVEHSTIPPYLTALWSIRDGYNRQVHRILKTIIRQEMLHMSLVANLLNAVGGAPSLIHSTFIPNYPTHLPGGLQPNLIVSLEKLSPEVIENVFMKIEKPDHTEKDRVFRKAIFSQVKRSILQQYCENASTDYQCRYFQGTTENNNFQGTGSCSMHVRDFLTTPSDAGTTTTTTFPSYKAGIASFYTHVLYVIAKLTNCGTNSSIFTGDPNRQLTTDGFSYGNAKLFKVTDYATAVKAVMTIIEEGEGTSDCDPAVHYLKAADDLSHYSMFHTIVKKHRVKILQKNKNHLRSYLNSTSEVGICVSKTFEFIKAVSDTVLDLIHAVYYDTSL